MQRCIAKGLVSADGFAVCASPIAADDNKQRSVPDREWKPEEIKETATRAEQEYFATSDDAAFGAASPVMPKFISRSDPSAQWSGSAPEPARGEGVDRDRAQPNSGRWMAGPAVVQTCIDGRKQPQGGPVEVRPTAGHHRDKAVMDEGRGGHRYGRAFGLG